jgi:hypothetical protein
MLSCLKKKEGSGRIRGAAGPRTLASRWFVELGECGSGINSFGATGAGRYALRSIGCGDSQRSLDRLRSRLNDTQQYPSGTVGDCPPLFPLLKSAHAEAELLSELGL